MNPKFAVLAVLGLCLICVAAYRITAKLSASQIAAITWLLAMGVVVYVASQYSPFDQLLWSFSYRSQPPAQALAIEKLQGKQPPASRCISETDVPGWIGTVETAVGADGGRAMFLVLRVGPRLRLQNAATFDADANSTRVGTAVYEQAQNLVTGDRVRVTGHARPMFDECAGGSRGEAAGNMIIDLTSIEQVPVPFVQAPLLQFMCWSLLASPAALIALWPRRSMDQLSPDPSRAQCGFNLAGVGPGSPGLPIALLVANCRNCLADGRLDESLSIANQLEAARPVDEAEWRLLSELFRTMKRRAADEIICERFLAYHPDNVTVQVHLAGLLPKQGGAGDRAAALARLLLRRDDLTLSQIITLAEVLVSCTLMDEGILALRRAVRLKPNDVGAQHRLVRALVEAERHREAKVELALLSKIVPKNPTWQVTIAEIAARLHDQATVIHFGAVAGQGITASDTALLRRLTGAYICSGQTSKAAAALGSLDLSSCRDSERLCELATLAEQYGFAEVALSVRRRLVEVAPHHQVISRYPE